MSIPGAASPLLLAATAAADAGPFKINRSLRFNSADSAYLNRTPSSAGNRRTWTWSGWVKRSKLGAQQALFNAGISSSNQISGIAFSSSSSVYDKLELWTGVQGVSTEAWCQSVAFLRDVSAWYHIVIAVDTTQSTAADRVKFYVNNSALGLAAYASYNTYPSQNYDYAFNNNVAHQIGKDSIGTPAQFDGYLADVYFIDGQALAPTDFGEYDSDNNWNPKDASGLTFGTNGFHLDFSDNTSTTTIAEDSSGNNNDWTANNFSVASGSGNDSLIDTPTNYDAASGNNGGNYATLNALNKHNTADTFSDGNLKLTGSGSGAGHFGRSTIGMSSGKYYCEVTWISTGLNFVGIQGQADKDYNNSYLYLQNGKKNANNGTAEGTSYGTTWGNGDTVGIAYDADNNTLAFYVNGSSQGTAHTNITGTYSPYPSGYVFFFGNWSGQDSTFTVNFGQHPFAYTPPTGYKSLCTQNLPDPTIADGSTVFDAKLYTGNGSTQSITGLGFSPDWVWTAVRDSTGYIKYLWDTVRGSTIALASSHVQGDDAESTVSNGLTSFDSSGFSLGNNGQVNENNRSMVAWCWDAGTSTVSNTDGGTTANVRASAASGFSIVSWSGHGSGSTTIGHGLNAAPELIIIKGRNNIGAWAVGSDYLGWGNRLELHTASASGSASADFNSTAPTSSVFTVGSNQGSGNKIAYCFAPVSQYSSVGVYSGNGSDEGPYVYTGFRPKFILTKAYSSNSNNNNNWNIYDTSRDPFNEASEVLSPNNNQTTLDNSHTGIDILSNGFKLKGDSNGQSNYNGWTYLYYAVAEHPFKTARAR